MPDLTLDEAVKKAGKGSYNIVILPESLNTPEIYAMVSILSRAKVRGGLGEFDIISWNAKKSPSPPLNLRLLLVF